MLKKGENRSIATALLSLILILSLTFFLNHSTPDLTGEPPEGSGGFRIRSVKRSDVIMHWRWVKEAIFHSKLKDLSTKRVGFNLGFGSKKMALLLKKDWMLQYLLQQ